MLTDNHQWKFCLNKTPVGPLLLTFTEKGLAGLEFSDCRALGTELPESLKPMVNQVARCLEDFFAGASTDFSHIAVDFQGTPFQIRVWQALREIPRGTTISYGELARRVGRPQTFRAVGQACGANPIPIIIPCHRVIAADGSLGGYSAGPERKRWLLMHEGWLKET